MGIYTGIVTANPRSGDDFQITYYPSNPAQLTAANISISTLGNNVILSGTAAYNVYRLILTSSAPVTITAISGSTTLAAWSFSQYDGIVLDFTGEPWFSTPSNNSFILSLSSTTLPVPTVTGTIYYTSTASSSTLLTSLVSFWTLANASTTDSYGTNTLTSGGTSAPASDTGPTSTITQATFFTGAGAIYTYMTVANNATLATTGSMFMSCWVNMTAGGGNRTICGKLSNLNTNSTIEYLLYYSIASNRFRFLVSNGSTLSFVDANTLGSPSTSTWYLLTGWYDSVGQTVNICVNSQTTPDSASATAGLQSSTNAFYMAANNNDLYPLQGDIASVGLWIGRTPTTSDLTALWNGGLGQTWPFV